MDVITINNIIKTTTYAFGYMIIENWSEQLYLQNILVDNNIKTVKAMLLWSKIYFNAKIIKYIPIKFEQNLREIRQEYNKKVLPNFIESWINNMKK